MGSRATGSPGILVYDRVKQWVAEQQEGLASMTELKQWVAEQQGSTEDWGLFMICTFKKLLRGHLHIRICFQMHLTHACAHTSSLHYAIGGS